MFTKTFFATIVAVSSLIILGIATYNSFSIILAFTLIYFLIAEYLIFNQNLRRLRIECKRKLDRKRVSVNSQAKCEVEVIVEERIKGKAIDMVDENLEVIGKNHSEIDGQSVKFSYKIKPKNSGVFVIGPLLLNIQDSLGLFTKNLQIRSFEKIVAFPSIKEIRKFDLIARRKLTEMFYGLRRSWYKGLGTEFYGVREYVQGDDPRTIDWKISAKFGELFTREYEAERRQRIVIAVDFSKNMLAGTPFMVNKAVDASLLLAYLAMKRGDVVGLATFSDDIIRYIQPNIGKMQFIRILEALADIRAEEKANFRKCFRKIAVLTKNRAFFIILSNLESEVKDIIESMKYLASRGHRALLLYIYPPDFEKFDEDIEKLIASAARERYEEKLDELKMKLSRYGITIIPVSPRTIIPLAVKNYLRLIERGVGAR